MKTTVQMDPKGTGMRCVTHDFGGESWTQYYIIPRELILAEVRWLRARGYRWNMFEEGDLVPDRLDLSEHYSGPGRAFSRAGGLFHKTRRYYTYVHSGGLDV